MILPPLVFPGQTLQCDECSALDNIPLNPRRDLALTQRRHRRELSAASGLNAIKLFTAVTYEFT